MIIALSRVHRRISVCDIPAEPQTLTLYGISVQAVCTRGPPRVPVLYDRSCMVRLPSFFFLSLFSPSRYFVVAFVRCFLLSSEGKGEGSTYSPNPRRVIGRAMDVRERFCNIFWRWCARTCQSATRPGVFENCFRPWKEIIYALVADNFIVFAFRLD